MSHIRFIKYFDNYFFKVISFFEMQCILWIQKKPKTLFWESFHKLHLHAWGFQAPSKKKKKFFFFRPLVLKVEGSTKEIEIARLVG